MNESLPTRERGLKSKFSTPIQETYTVAPHAGAWIEINYYGACGLRHYVAPHAGAWIEMGMCYAVRNT